MAAVVLTDNRRYSIPNQAFTALVMVLVLAALVVQTIIDALGSVLASLRT